MPERPPRIYVLAGTNGAGKSSILGASLREAGADYFDPDEAARRVRSAAPGLTGSEANGAAWHQGKRLLERAIAERLDYAFESTLGASTIPRLLAEAAALGIEIRVGYVGLSSPELHIARVRARVVKGGHDIPEADIRRRWETGRLNVIRLLPKLTELRVYDNSADADPDTGAAPTPMLALHVKRGRIVAPRDLRATPAWAKPLVATAMRLDAETRRRP
ncbi:MAG TPA: zeta toxin family protein [Thermoanaerobaculia bacterium]|nr:zeta toxin family protein [Thermoanaerobaculia bacterium]